MAFIDIKNEVIANVIDLPPAVSAAVPKLINQAIRSAERRYNFKYMEGNTQFITTPLVSTLGTILRFKEFRDRGPYVFQQFAPARQMKIGVSAGEVAQAWTLNTALPGDMPRWFRYSLDLSNTATILVDPFPDALSDWGDGNYRINVPHYVYSPTFASDADTSWLINNADDYIVFRATAEAFMKDWDYNSLALWKQQDEMKFTEVKQTDKKQRLAGLDTWVPHWEGAEQGMVD